MNFFSRLFSERKDELTIVSIERTAEYRQTISIPTAQSGLSNIAVAAWIEVNAVNFILHTLLNGSERIPALYTAFDMTYSGYFTIEQLGSLEAAVEKGPVSFKIPAGLNFPFDCSNGNHTHSLLGST